MSVLPWCFCFLHHSQVVQPEIFDKSFQNVDTHSDDNIIEPSNTEKFILFSFTTTIYHFSKLKSNSIWWGKRNKFIKVYSFSQKIVSLENFYVLVCGCFLNKYYWWLKFILLLNWIIIELLFYSFQHWKGKKREKGDDGEFKFGQCVCVYVSYSICNPNRMTWKTWAHFVW